jgi:hypothetical protein
MWVQTVVKLINKRPFWGGGGDIGSGDVDDSVCEFFVYMNSDFGPVYNGTR